MEKIFSQEPNLRKKYFNQKVEPGRSDLGIWHGRHMGGKCHSLVKHIPSVQEALGSNPRNCKTNKIDLSTVYVVHKRLT